VEGRAAVTSVTLTPRLAPFDERSSREGVIEISSSRIADVNCALRGNGLSIFQELVDACLHPLGFFGIRMRASEDSVSGGL
jgi:hypothetical protein